MRHVIIFVDRSSVAKITILGGYEKPSTAPYKFEPSQKPRANNILLSNGVTDMIIGNDTLFVSDEVRNEVAIIRNCISGKSVKNCSLELLSITAVMSLSFSNVQKLFIDLVRTLGR